MDNPRPEKVAVVNEVRERLDGAAGAILTEYRGLTVGEMAELRRALRVAGCEYKVYKNSLVKLAVAGGPHELLDPLLSGPTGIAFVSGDITAAARALRDYSRVNPNLVMKGALHCEGFFSAQDLVRLAGLPSREMLLASVAGAIAAPLQQLAGLLQALPRNFACGLAALIDERGGPPSGVDEEGAVAPQPQEDAIATAGGAEAGAGDAVTTEDSDVTEDSGPAQDAGPAEITGETGTAETAETAETQKESKVDG
jgi:large subunit ribosomal protein L10